MDDIEPLTNIELFSIMAKAVSPGMIDDAFESVVHLNNGTTQRLLGVVEGVQVMLVLTNDPDEMIEGDQTGFQV